MLAALRRPATSRFFAFLLRSRGAGGGSWWRVPRLNPLTAMLGLVLVALVLPLIVATSTDGALEVHRNPVLCAARASRGLARLPREPRADAPTQCDGWKELQSALGSDFQLDGYPLGKTPVAQWPQGFFGLLAGPLLVVHSLTLQLGSAGYTELSKPVVVDLGGWSPSSLRGGARRTTAFDRRRTDHTMETFWLPILRQLLPLVERLTLRGFGPELSLQTYVGSYGPQGWLRLELHQGAYPPAFQDIIPDATVLEMASLHDARWASAPAECATNQGLDVPTEAVAEALRSTDANGYFGSKSGVAARIPYACMWRASVDALISDPERVVFFTAGSGVEVLVAKRNLEIAGAEIVYPEEYISDRPNNLLQSTTSGGVSASLNSSTNPFFDSSGGTWQMQFFDLNDPCPLRKGRIGANGEVAQWEDSPCTIESGRAGASATHWLLGGRSYHLMAFRRRSTSLGAETPVCESDEK